MSLDRGLGLRPATPTWGRPENGSLRGLQRNESEICAPSGGERPPDPSDGGDVRLDGLGDRRTGRRGPEPTDSVGRGTHKMATPARRKFPLDRGYRREADYPGSFDRGSDVEDEGRGGGAVLGPSSSRKPRSVVVAPSRMGGPGGAATRPRDAESADSAAEYPNRSGERHSLGYLHGRPSRPRREARDRGSGPSPSRGRHSSVNVDNRHHDDSHKPTGQGREKGHRIVDDSDSSDSDNIGDSDSDRDFDDEFRSRHRSRTRDQRQFRTENARDAPHGRYFDEQASKTPKHRHEGGHEHRRRGRDSDIGSDDERGIRACSPVEHTSKKQAERHRTHHGRSKNREKSAKIKHRRDKAQTNYLRDQTREKTKKPSGRTLQASFTNQ